MSQGTFAGWVRGRLAVEKHPAGSPGFRRIIFRQCHPNRGIIHVETTGFADATYGLDLSSPSGAD